MPNEIARVRKRAGGKIREESGLVEYLVNRGLLGGSFV